MIVAETVIGTRASADSLLYIFLFPTSREDERLDACETSAFVFRVVIQIAVHVRLRLIEAIELNKCLRPDPVD